MVLAALIACSEPPPPGILLVTIDTWRRDHFTPTLTPNATALARRGRTYTDAWSPIGLTTPAHASLMTGLSPREHGVRANNHHGYVLDEAHSTLAEELAAAGWATAAFVSAWPAGPVGGLGQGFASFDAPEDGERSGDVAVSAALSWLADRDGPWFAWVHLYEPHGPYDPGPEARAAVGGSGDAGGYDGEVWLADQRLGPLLEATRHAHVVLTSDHGEVHDEEVCGWQHERSSSEHVLAVPLIVAGPTVERGEDGRRVGLVDVADTVRQWAGLPMRGEGLEGGREVWVGESGLCDPGCSRGCAPEGVLGKDRVVVGPTSTWVERPGTPGHGDPALAKHLPPRAVQAPTGELAPETTRALGYTE